MPTLYYEGTADFPGRPGFNANYNPYTQIYRDWWDWWHEDWTVDALHASLFSLSRDIINNYGANIYWCAVNVTVHMGDGEWIGSAGDLFNDHLPEGAWTEPANGLQSGTKEEYHTWWKNHNWSGAFATYWASMPMAAEWVIPTPDTREDIPGFEMGSITFDCDLNESKTGPNASIHRHYLRQETVIEFYGTDMVLNGEYVHSQIEWNQYTGEPVENVQCSLNLLMNFRALKDQYPDNPAVPAQICPYEGAPGYYPTNLPLSRDGFGAIVPMAVPWLTINAKLSADGWTRLIDSINSETSAVFGVAYLLVGHTQDANATPLYVPCKITITLSNPLEFFDWRQTLIPLRTQVFTYKPAVETDPASGTFKFTNTGQIAYTGFLLWHHNTEGNQSFHFADWREVYGWTSGDGNWVNYPVCDVTGYMWFGDLHAMAPIRASDYYYYVNWGDAWLSARYFVSRWYLKTAGMTGTWFMKTYAHQLPESLEHDWRTDAQAVNSGWVRPTHPAITVEGEYTDITAFARIGFSGSPSSVRWLCSEGSVEGYFEPDVSGYTWLAPPSKYLPEPLHPYWPTQGPYVQQGQ